ncbi:MAG: tRNA preQ1(34) S-adenosylmethionine ribosyltransferase-isomerase QueA [Anaerolineales bacterium]|nr:tRNA preQ1(34) S-adenosylmethionine ribosyltransferase-isomerase QueA [Anaerolineales bacterium]
MKTSDFDFYLPTEYIAQEPVEPRDAARLLVLHRGSGAIEHAVFRDLGQYLHPGDLLVLNETCVISARLYARKSISGGKVELLLLRQKNQHTWEALVGGKRLVTGVRLIVEAGPAAEILAVLDGPRRLVRFDEPIEAYLDSAGHVPLPPYIHKTLTDPERYQTVYARRPGSAAAPTAGLHFTKNLIKDLKSLGVSFETVTLHVGLDTFAPVTEEEPGEHQIHTEWCQVRPEVAETINITRRRGGRIISVGTTSVRTLESAAKHAAPGETVGAFEGPTGLFILPGYKFKVVDALVTNFHLPKSTLIMLVSAFAGRKEILEAYEAAKESGYRFYSFGDAMLIT